MAYFCYELSGAGSSIHFCLENIFCQMKLGINIFEIYFFEKYFF